MHLHGTHDIQLPEVVIFTGKMKNHSFYFHTKTYYTEIRIFMMPTAQIIILQFSVNSKADFR